MHAKWPNLGTTDFHKTFKTSLVYTQEKSYLDDIFLVGGIHLNIVSGIYKKLFICYQLWVFN